MHLQLVHPRARRAVGDGRASLPLALDVVAPRRRVGQQLLRLGALGGVDVVL